MRLIKVIFILLLFFVFGCGQSDKEAYEKAKLKDTIEGYQEFIQKYPKSEFRVSARNRVKGIKDKEARVAYKYAKLKETIEGYEEFIKKYPDNELRESAINQIKKIKDKEAHESALSHPCYGIVLVSWDTQKHYHVDWVEIRYVARVKNDSNRNKVVYLKYKLKGNDTWYPANDVKNLGKIFTARDVAVKVDSKDITDIEIRIDLKSERNSVENIAIDHYQ